MSNYMWKIDPVSRMKEKFPWKHLGVIRQTRECEGQKCFKIHFYFILFYLYSHFVVLGTENLIIPSILLFYQ